MKEKIMTESNNNLKLNSEQKSRLYKLGLDLVDFENDDNDNIKGELLLDLLSSKLPTSSKLLESLPDPIRLISQELKSLSGSTLGEILQDAHTKIITLRQIKDYTKELGSLMKNETEKEVILAIYFAAIACSLLQHNARITQYTYKELDSLFQRLNQQDWITPFFSNLFSKASQYCQSKME